MERIMFDVATHGASSGEHAMRHSAPAPPCVDGVMIASIAPPMAWHLPKTWVTGTMCFL